MRSTRSDTRVNNELGCGPVVDNEGALSERDARADRKRDGAVLETGFPVEDLVAVFEREIP